MMQFIMAFIFLLLAVPSYATTKYVDGSIANCAATYNQATRLCSGGSSTSYQTIESGIANLGASNTLIIRSGTYSGAGNVAPPSGTSAVRTVIQNQPGESFTWTKTSGSNAVGISLGANYVTFTCDVLLNCNWNGGNYNSPEDPEQAIFQSFGSTNITLENLHIYNNLGNCVYGNQTSNSFVIRGNKIHTCGLSAIAPHRGHAIYLESDSWLIEHNELSDTYGVGIHCYSGFAGNTCDNGTYRYNKIYNVAKGAVTQLAAIVIDGHNNLAYRNTIRCGATAGVDSAYQQGIQVYSFTAGNNDNLIYHNSITRCGVAIDVEGGSNSLRTLVTNNVMYLNTNNIVGNTNGTSTTNLTSNPSWANADSNDFTLQAGSAAISGGTAIAGFSCNGTCDQGAHETFGFSAAVINQASLDVTLNMSLNVPVLPGAALTGFTVACSGSGCGTPIVGSAAKVAGADSLVRLNLTGITTGVCAAGQTWTVSYSAGNVTDSALIGSGTTASNQPLSTFTTQAVTNSCAVGAPPTPPTVTGISYLFDDGSGTSAADATGGGSTGTLIGSPLPTWTTGKHAGGLSFPDQVGAYVAVPYGLGVNPFTQALTVCGGVLPLAGKESSQRIVWSTDNGTSQRFYLGWFGGTWGIGIQSSGFATNTEFPVAAGWTHLCLKASGGTATLYVNGVKGLSSQSVKTYTSYTLASNFKIGLEATNTINFGGSTQDEWKLFTSALTDQNITDLYANWEPPPPPPAAGVFAQKNHQFFNATTSIAGGTPVSLAAIGASATLVRPNTSFGLVTQTDCTGGACAPLGERLRYSYKPVATGVAGPFLAVPDVCGTDNICFFGASSNPLVLSGVITCCLSGALTAVDGSTQLTMGATPIVTLAQNSSVVQRRMLIVTTGAASGDIYYFKEYDQNDTSAVGFTAGTPYTPSAGAQLTIQNTTFNAPTGLRQTGAASNVLVDIIWSPNTDSTFAGFHIYESQTSGVYGSPVGTNTPASVALTHSSLTQFRTLHMTAGTYYYVVKAFDTSGNESAASAELTVVLTGPNARTAR